MQENGNVPSKGVTMLLARRKGVALAKEKARSSYILSCAVMYGMLHCQSTFNQKITVKC